MRRITGVLVAALVILPFLARAQGEQRTVTLITGDRVTLSGTGKQTVHMQPAQGREHLSFLARYEPVAGDDKPHLFVIPEDASSLIATDQLDRQLFDITELVQSRYDDANSDALSVLVTYAAQTRTRSTPGALLSGALVTRELSSINAVALEAPKRDIGRLWSGLTSSRSAAAAAGTPQLSLNGQVKKVWLDRRMQPLLDRSVPQIGAPAAWDAGYFGDGIVVAVLDTGIDTTHPDLAGKVIAQRNFTDEEDKDLVGHGTHVAATVAGTGAASGGTFRGVAPRADLISGKVCFVFGCFSSSIIAGMEWAVTEEGAKIVNVSLGGPNSPEIDPVEQAVNELTANYGALFVIAAGNSGGPATVSSPSTADAALSVGAIDRDERVASFSSRGPRAEDNGIKPEITAPGVGIMAARADGAASGNFYVRFSGTSMATPHVAGAAALLSQLHPDWGPQQLKAALIGSAKPNLSFSVFDQGAGRVDVAAAFGTSVTAEPATLGLGVSLWPHDDDLPVTRTVTYRNSGTTTITLTLKVEAAGPGGAASPPGMFSLDTTTLTIAAGASASARLTVDTRVTAPDGIYSGKLVARAGASTVITPLAIEREVESYDVRVTHLDWNGAPFAGFLTRFIPLDRRILPIPEIAFVSGEARIRLPAGDYAVASLLLLSPATFIHDSHFRVDGPQSLTIDARTASPLQPLAPTTSADQIWTEFVWTLRLDAGTFSLGLVDFGPVALATANLDAPVENFSSYLSAQWTDVNAAGAPLLYAATWPQRGSLASGAKAIDSRNVATVDATYASAFPDLTEAFAGTVTILPDTLLAFVPFVPVSLPQRRTEIYYGPEADIRWVSLLLLFTADSFFELDGVPLRYAPRRKYTSRWNEPPFAPALPTGAADSTGLDWVVRIGDTIDAFVPLFGDAAGHAGFASGDTRLQLFRNGQKIGESDELVARFEVPPEPASYRLLATGSQNVFGLSTQVTAAWTFASEHVAETATTLPLLTLQFKPRLNERGQASRKLPLLMPIIARQQTELDPVRLDNLRLDASFDDGRSWKAVPVARVGHLWIALLKHPSQGDFVSLRAVAKDRAGNAVEETVIRAYGLTQ